MENPKFNQIDLLRGRREELGLSEPFFIDTKKYIKKGIFIGLSIISVSLSIGLAFIIRTSVLEERKSKVYTKIIIRLALSRRRGYWLWNIY